jgi:hypothetical protein
MKSKSKCAYSCVLRDRVVSFGEGTLHLLQNPISELLVSNVRFDFYLNYYPH